MLLIACPECSRQYDVTGLDPGTLVRCFCEGQITVGWPPKLSAGALMCTHCGGAVSTTDDNCPYCQAAISEADRRKTTLCPGCYTRIEDDSQHCKSCGLDIRPQALAPLPLERDCPRCDGELQVRSLNIVDVVECRECLGMWLTPETFKKVTVKATRESGAAGLFQTNREEPVPFKKVEDVRYIPCLSCGELMNRRQYTQDGRGSRVVIDVCRHHGVWLDHQEIERIVEFIQSGGATGVMARPLDPKPFIVTGSKKSSLSTPSSRRSYNLVEEALAFVAEWIFWT